MSTIVRQLKSLREYTLPVKTMTLDELCRGVGYPHYKAVNELIAVLSGFPGMQNLETVPFKSGRSPRTFYTYVLQHEQAKMVLKGLDNLLSFKLERMKAAEKARTTYYGRD